MNSSKFRFVLDLHSTQSQIAIPVTKGDTARVWYISLSDGGQPYVIAEGCLAKMEIKRPTGTFLEVFCSILNNTTIRYDFAQDVHTAAVEGVHDCSVTLYDAEGNQIAAPRFSMIVSDRIVNRDDINIPDEGITALESMIAKEAERQAAEAGRVNAEAERVEAEKGRASAELGREAAESSRATRADSKMAEVDTKIAAVSSKLSGVDTKMSEVNALVTGKIGEVDAKLASTDALITSKVSEIDGKITEVNSKITEANGILTQANNKLVEVGDKISGIDFTKYYTKSEVDSQISNAITTTLNTEV